LNPGSTLTGSGTLTVDGTLNVKGTNFSDNYTGFSSYAFNPGSTVNYNGTSGAQNVGALTYDNLSLNNSSGATQAGDVTVNNTLTLTSGTYNIGSSLLTIKKAIGGTATNLSSTSGSSLTIAGTGAGITIPTSVSALSPTPEIRLPRNAMCSIPALKPAPEKSFSQIQPDRHTAFPETDLIIILSSMTPQAQVSAGRLRSTAH
jgi:hypothetical protein